VVGTGSAVSPVYLLCLSAQSWRQDRSVDLPPFDGLKAFPSLVRLCLPTAPALVVHFQGTRLVELTRMPRPVSQTTGISAVPHT
jgi:hypothetical protein